MSRKEGLAKHIKRVHKDATFFEWTDEGVLDDHPSPQPALARST